MTVDDCLAELRAVRLELQAAGRLHDARIVDRCIARVRRRLHAASKMSMVVSMAASQETATRAAVDAPADCNVMIDSM